MKPAPPVTRSFTWVLARLRETLFAVDDGRESGVLRIQERVARRAGPFDAEPLAEPVQAPFMRGRIPIVDLVSDDRIRLQRTKAMRETSGYQKLFAALGCQLGPDRA